jgi:hypothetical protein
MRQPHSTATLLALRLSLVPALTGAGVLPLLVSAPAFAQSDADRATARALGQEGEAALQNKDYAAAEDRFRRADKLIHAPTLELGLARALVGLGKLVEAQETYNRIVREGVAPGAPAVFAKALQDAKKEVEAVSPRLGSVTITVKAGGGGEVPNEQVTLDGVPVNTASLGVRRFIDPGAHVLQANGDGFKPGELRFNVAEGATAEAPLVLERGAAPQVAAAPSPTGAAPEAAPGGATPNGGEATEPHKGLPGYLPWVAFGIGGAGLILGGVTGGLAMGAHSTLAGECPGGVCPASKQSDVDSFHTLGLLSTIGFAVGGVGAATGIVLLLIAPKHESAPAAARLQVVPLVGPEVGPGGVGGIQTVGRF